MSVGEIDMLTLLNPPDQVHILSVWQMLVFGEYAYTIAEGT